MQEEDASVVVDGVRIVGKIARPAGAVRAAALILPGSLFSDVDGDYPSWNVRPHALRDIAHQFAARGVASMRQAKIGPGTGSETIDAEAARAHQRFDNRVVVARAAVAHLRAAVPGARIFVAGHSEGALVASMYAGSGDADIDGVISLSGPALRLLDVMRSQAPGMTPPGFTLDMAAYDRAIADIRAGRPLADEARTNPSLAWIASPEALAFITQIDAVDPLATIARVQQRMLLVQGGRDQSVMPEQVDMLAAARGALPTEIARFPELQHMYKRAAPGLSAMASFALSDESDPAVADAMVRWIG